MKTVYQKPEHDTAQFAFVRNVGGYDLTIIKTQGIYILPLFESHTADELYGFIKKIPHIAINEQSFQTALKCLEAGGDHLDHYDWENRSMPIELMAPHEYSGDAIRLACGYSGRILVHAPHLFDRKKFDWENESWVVAKYAPQYYDKELYNHQKDNWALAQYMPTLLP